MALDFVNPDSLHFNSTSSHGILAPANSRMLFIAGQYGTDQEGRVPNAHGLEGVLVQFHWALQNVLSVVTHVGGGPESIAQLTIYTTSVSDFRSLENRIFDTYRQLMGPHRPALTIHEVGGLLRADAKVMISGHAFLTADDLGFDLDDEYLDEHYD